MSASRFVAFLASVLLCASAGAEQIRWNNIPSAPAPIFNPPTISFTPIGPNTYGSDGSSSYRSGNTTINSNGTSSYSTGNITTHSDGTRSQAIGDTTYVTRPDGSQLYCRWQGSQAVCHPR